MELVPSIDDSDSNEFVVASPATDDDDWLDGRGMRGSREAKLDATELGVVAMVEDMVEVLVVLLLGLWEEDMEWL